MTLQTVIPASETLPHAAPAPADSAPRPRGGDILALGFAITVALWLTAYISRLPMVELPAPVTVLAMLAVIFLGGFLAARFSSLRAAIGAGALSGLLDLILISSLIHDLTPSDLAVAPSLALWIGGSILLNTLIATLGGLLARAFPARRAAPIAWASVFSLVLVLATLFLIAAGGFVTANRAGLAVPDWPRSFGYNMFLFPLSVMQKDSGKFFEHAHRLMGSLVGLISFALALYVTFTERRLWVKFLAWSIFIGVGIQGVLGGLRVTDKSETLAIVHGAFAQIVFAAMATLVAVTSRNFQTLPRLHAKAASTDRLFTLALVAALLLQLVLGTILRHTSDLLLLHITMAAFVTVLTLACGFRSWGLYGSIRPLRTTGLALLAVVCLQIALGILALTFWNGSGGAITTTSVLLTTAHQVNGALFLATAAALTAWTWKTL
jgi:cytochrome c oxidase assembly protein subunit 15